MGSTQHHSAKAQATLYRMATDDHICPYGLKAKNLLRREGFVVEDNLLTSRAQTDEFKEKHSVKTTPQIFINGERIGGYDDLRVYLGKDSTDDNDKDYAPIIAIFSVAGLIAMAISYLLSGNLLTVKTAELFVALSMCILAVMKLRDLESFTIMFLGYDVLARKNANYAYVYPFVEAAAGILMIVGGLTGAIAAPFALFIGIIGAWSVFKAVYIDKRDLKCACVGGNSNVPLGFISLSENLGMVGMAIWMLVKFFY